MDGKFGEKEQRALKQFQRVVNGVVDVNKEDTKVVDGTVSQNGGTVKWLNAYNAPHWMDIGGQMQYQGGVRYTTNGSYSMPGWNNTQNATTGGSVEKYGTSWTRDLLRAKQYASSLYNLSPENPVAYGSLFNAAVDANHGISLSLHSSHGAGMNIDLGIARSFLTGVFLTSTAVAGDAIDTTSLTAPAAGTWSNQYAHDVTDQLPNGVNDDGFKNYQRDAMREFLSIYSITRNNGDEASGWDDLIAQATNGGTPDQKKKIITALFGDGTANGSIIGSVLIGGDRNKRIANPDGYFLTDNPNQAELKRMGDVLRALGVPRHATQVPDANTTYNVDAHFNHFHLNIKPPARVDIETSNNLLAAQEDQPIMLAAAPSPTATDAASTPVTAATQKVKYDAVYSMCGYMHSADQVPVYIERDNHLSPMLAIYSYFFDRGTPLNRASGVGEPEPVRVTMLKNPTHGELVVRNKSGTSLTYHANPGYLGSDQMIFEVEVLGKKFKVIQTVVVHNSGNPDFPTDAAKEELYRLCPSYNRSSLDIIELPTDGFASDEELAKLHSLLSFALGSEYSANGGSLNIADLAGGAVGQTTGTNITLDTTAAGHNWFIDTTPADNSEYLPTSNPYEWVAKEGSDAYGKMDMLSVLLHEYGHALGIEHSADNHDYMATTLTPGVRRMPSAEELALMQRLVGQVKSEMTATLSPSPSPASGRGWPAGSGEGGGLPLPIPLGAGFGMAFLGRLRGSRYGDVSIVPDYATLITRYEAAANASFATLDSPTGWNTIGGVEIDPSTGSGRTASATLREVSTSQTRLGQVFAVNEEDRYLTFTLSGTALDNLTGAPDDAFEVALLDANHGGSLLGTDGLTRTDAIINLQGDGTQHLADCVTCTYNSDGSRTYRIDLSGIAAGTVANLSFDLLGFGADNSHVTVGNVRVSGLPELHDDAATLVEDGTLAYDPFAQVDNAAVLQLGSHLVYQPAHGSVTVNADGTFSYTPEANYFGTDSFTYRLSDGPLESNLATVSLSVTAVNDAPVAADVQLGTNEDTPLVITLGAYGSDIDSSELATLIVTGPAHGALIRNADGTFTYTPEANFNGSDSFTYKINGRVAGYFPTGEGFAAQIVTPR